jgi:hypothetical protein
MYSALQHESCAPRLLGCVHPLGARTEEPQRGNWRNPAEPEIRNAEPGTRNKSKLRLGVRTLLRTRMSARRFGCDLAALRPPRLCGLARFLKNAWLHLRPRDP